MLKKEKIFLVTQCVLVLLLGVMIDFIWADDVTMLANATYYLFLFIEIDILVCVFVGIKSLRKHPKDKLMWIIFIITFAWLSYMLFGVSIMNLDSTYYKLV